MECTGELFDDVTRSIVGAETILMCMLSLVLQVTMVKVARTFCGWQSDFSYILLCMLAIVGVIFYTVELVGHLRFIVSSPTSAIDKFIGANFMACFFTETFISVSLVAHRVVYTIIPFKARVILNETVLKIYMALVAAYFITMVAFMCTPVAGVVFCPQSMSRRILRDSLKFVIDWTNTVCNYLVGISTVTAYTFLVSFLIIRGNIRFRSNAELRMMTQIAVMSTIGVFYFFYWEFHSSLIANSLTGAIVYENLSLFYYDAVVLPYLLLNNTFRERFVRTFRRKKNLKKAFFITVAKMDCLGKQAGPVQPANTS